MTPTYKDAARRARVRTLSGRTGTLVHVTRRSLIATVVLDHGYRYRMPAAQLVLVLVEQPAAEAG